MDQKSIAALVLIFSVIILSVPFLGQTLSFDELVYLSMSKGMLEDKGYGWVCQENIDGYRAPLLSATIYGIYLLTGPSELAGKFALPLISVSTVVFVFYVLRKEFDARFAVFSVFLIITNHFFLFFSNRVMAENLVGLLLFSNLVLVWYSFKDKRFLPLFGILSALTFLVRYNAVIVPLISFILFLLIFERRQILDFVKSKYLYVAAVTFLLTLTPWFVYGLEVYGEPLGPAFSHLERSSNTDIIKSTQLLTFLPFVLGLPSFFVLSGIKKVFEQRNKFITLVFLFLLLSITSAIVTGRLSIRYLIQNVIFLGVIAIYGLTSYKKGKIMKISFVIFCLISAVVGLFAIYLYSSSWSENRLPEWFAHETYFGEHKQRREAAVWLKENTDTNETISTDLYPLVCWYAERNWSETPSTAEEFLADVNAKNIKYLYTEHNFTFLNNESIELVYNQTLIKVYKIK